MTFLLLAAVSLAATYAAAAGALYLVQDAMIFPYRAVGPARHTLPPGTERLELRTPDGDHRLVGNLVRAPRQPSRGLVVGFGGNAWNADDFTGFLAERLTDLDVAAFHYRGYAPSEGRPSEATVSADAVLVHDALVGRLRPRRVIAAGFSIGSGVAAHLAAERRVDGLLLVTPFDSIEAVARARHPWAPVRALLRHPFRSDLRLGGLDVPAAVIAAGADRVVPPERSRALLAVLRRPVFEETVPGATHGGLYHVPEIDGALRRAVEALLAAADARAKPPEREPAL